MKPFLQSNLMFKDIYKKAQESDILLDENSTLVVNWLARLRLMQGVPFAYLVPHEEFLPHESIRFFYVNRNWTDRAVEGALSVGGIGTRERSLLQKAYNALRIEIDNHERRVASDERGFPKMMGNAEVLTGFLLRSHAVSGWPGLHVRAYRDDDSSEKGTEIELLRMERLAPAVLLVVMDGIPDRVEIEEPRQGIQFGVRPDAGDDNTLRQVPLRDPDTGKNYQGSQKRDIGIPFRCGSPGVIDVKQLVADISIEIKRIDPNFTEKFDSAELALQMLRYPYQQVFGKQDAVAMDQLFFATIGYLPIETEEK